MLATKLHRPSVPSRRVLRPHLIQRLNEGLELDRQMTLISAPPGFGKSTCAAEWVSGLNLPTAWVSLDRSDDDPVRFFACLLAALQRVDEALGQEIRLVVNSGQVPPAEVIATSLINDIIESGVRFLLLLDDFQVIQDGTIHAALAMMLTNQPRNMHLVLLTREDPSLPLARLRANNQITEIRAGELRFTSQEVDCFLNQVMGLNLSPANVTVLAEKTEGWIAGLQLAGLSMREREDPSGFVARLSGNHRYILSYLTEEVLNLQPPEIQRFLLQTAVLNRLNGSLCDAVTGRTDSTALLERLFRANLFLIPLDDEQRWYRYHHLFADLLRNVQDVHQKDHARSLHQRASHWYAQAGMPGEAIPHALDAADYGLAVTLLEEHATEMIVQGYARTVEGWLHAIPAEMRLHSPRTDLAFTWMHVMCGTPDKAFLRLKRLQDAFARSPIGEDDSLLRTEWLALQSYLAIGQENPAQGLSLAARALQTANEGDGYAHSLASNALAIAHLQMGHYADAVEVYQAAIEHGRAAGNLTSELLSTSVLAQVALQHGQYSLAFEIASQMATRLEGSISLPPMSSIPYGALGQVCYQWQRFEEARRHLLRSIRLSVLGGYKEGEIFSRALLARLFCLVGDLESAGLEIQTAANLVVSGIPVWVRSELISEQVRVYLAQDRLAEAQAVLMGQGFNFDEFSFPERPLEQTFSYEEGLLCNSALRVLLYRARARHDLVGLRRGLEDGDRLVSGACGAGLFPVAVKALLIRAQMLAVLGDQQASLHEYRRALEWTEPEGMVATFLEEGAPAAEGLTVLLRQSQLSHAMASHIRKILAALLPDVKPERGSFAPAPESASPPELIESLSQREREVLLLIEAGCSNQEIAQRLVLSVHTVKKHTSNIFSKLEVSSRTQAVARARHLRIL